MIALGKIVIHHSLSIREARNKIFTVVRILTQDSLLATRISTATSEMCRRLYLSSITPIIELELDTSGLSPVLILSFTDEQPLLEADFLSLFFDKVDRLLTKDNRYKIQSLVSLKKCHFSSNNTIEEVKAIMEQKSRNELMTELEVKNRHLYESLENLKQTTLIKEKLKEENLRMGTELNVARQMQKMILPKSEELEKIKGVDIACFMEPADEVGGDYYDILEIDGVVTIGIGDVTGHGLESGILMIMTQVAVRTLQEIREVDPIRFLDALNRTIYKNVQRMNSDRNLTLAILNYSQNKISISGQHEETIVVRNGGHVERVDTMDLGFPIGLDDNITDFIDHVLVKLNPGDGIVLYTDGVTEAKNMKKEQYGLDRLCEVISQSWQGSAQEIQEAIIENLRQFIGQQKVFDDITLVILKQ